MEIMFDSANKNFLKLYEPTITFLDEAEIVIGEREVIEFLEDYGLTKEDLKNVGMKCMKNRIAISKGLQAEVLDINTEERATTLRIGDIEFDCYLTMNADFCMVEATNKNQELEMLYRNYKNAPKEEDSTKLYGFPIGFVVSAILYYYKHDNRRYAFEHLKNLTEDEIKFAVELYTTKVISEESQV